jgi:hypothetical protein
MSRVGRSAFELFDFLSLHVIKTDKLPIINMIYPIEKNIQIAKPGEFSISGGRTSWKIYTGPKIKWERKQIPEVSTLILTPTAFKQWPSPRVMPLIEKIDDGEALITFFGYENWDTYFGDASKQM